MAIENAFGPLDVRVTPGPYGCPVVSVVGDVDFSNRRTLAGMIDIAHRVGEPLMFLDLRGLRFIDSAGLHVIVTAHRARRRGTMLIVRPAPPVARIFGFAGLADHLTFIECLPGERPVTSDSRVARI